MIDRQQAIQIAEFRLRKSKGWKNYQFDSCDFFEERSGRYAAPARWVVRYVETAITDCVIDDGDQLLVVTILASNGEATVKRGF